MFCTFTVALSAVRGMCAVLNMAVYCSSLISSSPGVLLRYCLSDFEMAPVAPIVRLYHFAFTFYIIIIIIIVKLLQETTFFLR